MPKLLTALAGWGLADEDDDEPNGPKVNWAIYLSGLEIEAAKEKTKWASNRFTHKHKSVRARSWIRIPLPSFLLSPFLSLKQVQQRTDLPTSLRSHRRLPRRNPRRRRRHRRRCWYDPRFLLLTLQNRSLPRTPPRAQSNPPKLLRISPGPSRAEPSGQV